MPLGKRRTRAGFQIPLERESAGRFAEDDHEVELPGAMTHRVDAFASVVLGQALLHVGRHAGVVAIAIAKAAKYVDESFGWSHDRAWGNGRAEANC